MIDCFAGVGGNTIHFALSGRWERVYGIEKDAEVLACARHNAEIYGVADQIEWIEGDCFDVLKDLVGRDGGDGTRVVLFGSPPWGGGFISFFFLLFFSPPVFCSRFVLVSFAPEIAQNFYTYMAGVTGYIGPGYRLDSVFDLSKMQPYNLNDLLDLFLSLTDDAILYLPRTSDLRQLAARAQGGEDEKMTVMHYCMDGASKVCRPKKNSKVILCIQVGESINENCSLNCWLTYNVCVCVSNGGF